MKSPITTKIFFLGISSINFTDILGNIVFEELLALINFFYRGESTLVYNFFEFIEYLPINLLLL